MRSHRQWVVAALVATVMAALNTAPVAANEPMKGNSTPQKRGGKFHPTSFRGDTKVIGRKAQEYIDSARAAVAAGDYTKARRDAKKAKELIQLNAATRDVRDAQDKAEEIKKEQEEERKNRAIQKLDDLADELNQSN